MTKTRQLEKMFGGKWAYVAGLGWFCDDPARYVVRGAKGLVPHAKAA